jgi:hypothetical protein
MRKLKTFVAVLMLVFVLGLAAPKASFADGGVTQGPNFTQGVPNVAPEGVCGETQGPAGLADWAGIIFQILGNGWNV